MAKSWIDAGYGSGSRRRYTSAPSAENRNTFSSGFAAENDTPKLNSSPVWWSILACALKGVISFSWPPKV